MTKTSTSIISKIVDFLLQKRVTESEHIKYEYPSEQDMMKCPVRHVTVECVNCTCIESYLALGPFDEVLWRKGYAFERGVDESGSDSEPCVVCDGVWFKVVSMGKIWDAGV